VSEAATRRLGRVQDQLLLYEHPLVNISARGKGEGVEVMIQFKDASVPVRAYCFDLHPPEFGRSAV
jgi:hypothetical protein